MQFRKFAPLVKVNEATREVDVLVTSEVTDLAKEKLDWETTRPYIVEYSESVRKITGDIGVEPSLGNVRMMHSAVIGGKFTDIVLDDAAKAWTGTIKVKDGEPWEDVLAGHVTGVSIGGDYIKRWDDPLEKGVKRYTASINEVSLVDRPCNKEATFLAIRKDGGSELRKFAPRDVTQTWDCGNDGCLERHIRKDDARRCLGSFTKTAGDSGDEAAIASEKADGYSYKAPRGKDTAAYHRDAQAAHSAAAEAHRTAQAEAKDAGENTLARQHGAAVDKHEEHAAAHGAIAAAHEAAAKQAGGAMNKVAERKDTTPKEGKDKYGDVEFADSENKKYPIDTEAHIRAAWNYINKPKNADKYSAVDLKSIKAKIVAAWKDKIDKDGPPAAEKSITNGTLLKCLQCVAQLAYATQTIDAIADGIHCPTCDAYGCSCDRRCAGPNCGCCYSCNMQFGVEQPLSEETTDMIEDSAASLFNALVSAAEDVRDADAAEDALEEAAEAAVETAEADDAVKILTALASSMRKASTLTKLSKSLRVPSSNGSKANKSTKEAPMDPKLSKATKTQAAKASEKANDFPMDAPEGTDDSKHHADAQAAHEKAAEAHRAVADKAEEEGDKEDATYHNRVADKHEEKAAEHAKMVETEKSAGSGKMLKAIGDVGTRLEGLLKQLEKRDEQIGELDKAVSTLTKTVEFLMGQPAAPMGALRVTPVTKAEDAAPAATNDTPTPPPTTTTPVVKYGDTGITQAIAAMKKVVEGGLQQINVSRPSATA